MIWIFSLYLTSQVSNQPPVSTRSIYCSVVTGGEISPFSLMNLFSPSFVVPGFNATKQYSTFITTHPTLSEVLITDISSLFVSLLLSLKSNEADRTLKLCALKETVRLKQKIDKKKNVFFITENFTGYLGQHYIVNL